MHVCAVIKLFHCVEVPIAAVLGVTLCKEAMEAVRKRPPSTSRLASLNTTLFLFCPVQLSHARVQEFSRDWLKGVNVEGMMCIFSYHVTMLPTLSPPFLPCPS